MYFNMITLFAAGYGGEQKKTGAEMNLRKILGDRSTYEVFFNKLRKYKVTGTS